MASSINNNKATAAGVLVAMGIVFGDIGTSPLYAVAAIFKEASINHDTALGVFSAIFWTLTLQTTLKYVIVTLRADNNGEGGIFSLYALVRRYRKGLIIPAIVGGAFLLADGLLTPPVSVSSAVEGLLVINPGLDTVPIVIAIIILLFVIQQFGTASIGIVFGPVMVTWFGFIGSVGLWSAIKNPEVFHGVNPYYAYQLLTTSHGGFWILGGVFLCTTGAEALYSDMGHCGKSNIRISWIFVKICLLLSYAGQCSWALDSGLTELGDIRPFYAIVPRVLLFPSIILATMATIIASQALISGSFTLISEAMRLDVWPKLKIIYPTNQKGQIYIPLINWFLMIGCIGIVLYFKESTNMEGAYGLSVTITMLMTTILLGFYLQFNRVNFGVIGFIWLLYFLVEGSFLAANITKFFEGGWITFMIGMALVIVMFVWNAGYNIKKSLMTFDHLDDYIPKLKTLSTDESIAKTATHLVYLTSSINARRIESRIPYSIFFRTPKRADIYWFIHINVEDDPYTCNYEVDFIDKEDIIWITFYLGFRIEPRINLFFRKVVEELVNNHEININSRYASLKQNKMPGDFKFVLLESFLSYDNDMSWVDKILMKSYFILKMLSISDQASFGLDTSNVTIEKVPLVVNPVEVPLIRRNPKY